MVTAKLNKGYNFDDKRRATGSRAVAVRWGFVVCLLLILLSAGLTFGYISRLSIVNESKGAGAASRVKRYADIEPALNMNSRRRAVSIPLFDAGLEFNGENHFVIHSYDDSDASSITLWFFYVNDDSTGEMIIFANRDIVCTADRSCNGFAIYINGKTRKLEFVWKSRDDANHKEIVATGRLVENNWNHMALIFNKNKNVAADGVVTTAMEIYLNGGLSLLRRISRIPAGNVPLYIGSSPSNANHFKGRIFSVMISSNPFKDSQVSALYENQEDSVNTLSLICDGVFLLRSEKASKVRMINSSLFSPSAVMEHTTALEKKKRDKMTQLRDKTTKVI